MRLSAGGNVNLAIPSLQHCYRQVRRSAEAEQPNAFPSLDARYSQAPKANDTGAKQRRSVQIVESIRKRKDEVAAGKSNFSVSARHRIASERWRVAQILHALLAIETGAVGSANPGHAYARAQRKVGSRAVDDFSHDLMSWNQSQLFGGQLSFNDVQIGAAYSACTHPQQHMPRSDPRIRDIYNL